MWIWGRLVTLFRISVWIYYYRATGRTSDLITVNTGITLVLPLQLNITLANVTDTRARGRREH